MTWGPIQNRPQYERVIALLEDARARRPDLLQGGTIPDGQGYFVPVTIVDNPPKARGGGAGGSVRPHLADAEVLQIDDVIDRANASEYGLGGSVWSADTGKALEIARRIETGTV